MRRPPAGVSIAFVVLNTVVILPTAFLALVAGDLGSVFEGDVGTSATIAAAAAAAVVFAASTYLSWAKSRPPKPEPSGPSELPRPGAQPVFTPLPPYPPFKEPWFFVESRRRRWEEAKAAYEAYGDQKQQEFQRDLALWRRDYRAWVAAQTKENRRARRARRRWVLRAWVLPATLIGLLVAQSGYLGFIAVTRDIGDYLPVSASTAAPTTSSSPSADPSPSAVVTTTSSVRVTVEATAVVLATGATPTDCRVRYSLTITASEPIDVDVTAEDTDGGTVQSLFGLTGTPGAIANSQRIGLQATQALRFEQSHTLAKQGGTRSLTVTAITPGGVVSDVATYTMPSYCTADGSATPTVTATQPQPPPVCAGQGVPVSIDVSIAVTKAPQIVTYEIRLGSRVVKQKTIVAGEATITDHVDTAAIVDGEVYVLVTAPNHAESARVPVTSLCSPPPPPTGG